MNVTAIYGPPGTGKTETLVNMVSELYETYEDDMAVLSFSRSGARELLARTTVKPRFVGTIHAMCFRELGLTRSRVADQDKYLEWVMGDEAQIRMSLQLGGYARRTGKNLEEVMDDFRWNLDMPPYHLVNYYWDSYINWKDGNALYDFDDMIDKTMGTSLRFGCVIVDEAQDLSNQQWDLIKAITRSRLVMAGDDDQSIYTWAGANPTGMLGFAMSDDRVLQQSYRVPKAIHSVAQATVKEISYRKHKNYLPTNRAGSVMLADSFSAIDLKPDTLIMCRDRYVQEQIEEILIEEAVPYNYVSPHRPGLFDNAWAKAIRAVIEGDLDRLVKYKSRLSPMGRHEVEQGRIPDNWMDAINVPVEWINYYDRVDLLDDPSITLSTIHAQKGREADHVMLCTEHSPRTDEMMDSTPTRDDEIRVWYVGITRARKSLTLLGGGNNFITLERRNDG